jgi:putative intracellular protease/amidase
VDEALRSGFTMQRCAYLYVLDTMSDWEPGYAIAELNSGRYFRTKGQRLPVKTVGVTDRPVTTMGGLRLTPDVLLQDVVPDSTAIFVVVGADTWSDPRHTPALDKVHELLNAGTNVAAICGATAALANAGVFDHRPHTSNSLAYLEMFAPRYKGKPHYVDAVAITEGNLITAGSAGSLLFAKHILKRLDVFSDATLEAWYRYFATGDEQHFFAMMSSLRSPESVRDNEIDR